MTKSYPFFNIKSKLRPKLGILEDGQHRVAADSYLYTYLDINVYYIRLDSKFKQVSFHLTFEMKIEVGDV